MSVLARLGGAAIAGLLCAVSLWRAGTGWVAWAALIPLFAGLDGASRRVTMLAAIIYTLVLGMGAVEPWLAAASRAYFDVGIGRTLAYTVLALTALCVAHGALLGLLLLRRSAHRGPWDVVWCAAVWVCWEAFGMLVFPYSPGVVLGLSQHASTAVLQVASACGITGVTFVLVAFNVGLASVLRPSSAPGRVRALAAVTGIVVAGMALLGGTLRVGRAAAADSVRGPDIVAVDVNAARESAGTLERYLAASEAAAVARPALLIWPESALTTDIERDPTAWDALGRFVAAHGVSLLAGGPGSVLRAGRGMLYFNSAHFLRAGEGLRSYHKRFLMPIAEQWPPILGSPPSDLANLAAGHEATIFSLGDGAFGVLICFEVTNAVSARDLVRGGARFIVNITNDAWFAAAPYVPHLDWAAVRAVETGLPVVRAANAGVSAVFDRWGREVAHSEPLDAPALMAATVPAGVPTLYARAGDAFVAVCLAIVLTGVARAWRPRRAAPI